jgi:hypothetical protein
MMVALIVGISRYNVVCKEKIRAHSNNTKKTNW